MILFALLPASARPYAKAIVAAIGLVLSTAAAVIPGCPSWVTVVVAFLTALGVYAQPNADANGNGIPDDLEAVLGDGTPGKHAA